MVHYNLERELTNRLKASQRHERSRVYSEVYGELFASPPDHPQHTASGEHSSARVKRQVALIANHLHPTTRYLEIGCGDAAITFAVASKVAYAWGLDVTESLMPADRPPNFVFLKADGIAIPLPDGSVDLIYSYQLMEHVHPEDVAVQLADLRRVLAPGGVYRCCTPSRYTGPHDVSAYFDYEATGLHLKEYDYKSIRQMFLAAGFDRLDFYMTGGSRRVRIPYWLGHLAETVMDVLPKGARTSVARLPFINQLMGLTVDAWVKA